MRPRFLIVPLDWYQAWWRLLLGDNNLRPRGNLILIRLGDETCGILCFGLIKLREIPRCRIKDESWTRPGESVHGHLDSSRAQRPEGLCCGTVTPTVPQRSNQDGRARIHRAVFSFHLSSWILEPLLTWWDLYLRSGRWRKEEHKG